MSHINLMKCVEKCVLLTMLFWKTYLINISWCIWYKFLIKYINFYWPIFTYNLRRMKYLVSRWSISMSESQWSIIIFQKLHFLPSVISRWIIVILIRAVGYQTYTWIPTMLDTWVIYIKTNVWPMWKPGGG